MEVLSGVSRKQTTKPTDRRFREINKVLSCCMRVCCKLANLQIERYFYPFLCGIFRAVRYPFGSFVVSIPGILMNTDTHRVCFWQ